ncbi:hypothetical protein SAMN05444365_101746 [Micromonospora pattaloongensis]|uniref:Uncharacterized protein n=1 Tax=Micromonospora pattaloongensis TaxID=405436 RepID=A0A1H3HA08_9ACTN|nr:hypothetical protein [Micromonospora pattaloongensis]SDY12311.1 hypothetical protein SAMN05444365_101746 [Micromonospora pattaloongensis]
MSREPLPDPFAGQPQWAPRPPRPVAPAPAGSAAELRGRRVIAGLPGHGWRADLRADEKVVQGSRSYVPVIPEHEWYRAEAEQIEVFAPLVPAERIWVEQLGSANPTPPHRGDVVSRLVSLDAPPLRVPVPVVDADSVTGRRVVQVVEGAERRDLRAVTEVHTSADGDICVRVAAELDWYRWAWSGQPPKTLEIPVHELWVE